MYPYQLTIRRLLGKCVWTRVAADDNRPASSQQPSRSPPNKSWARKCIVTSDNHTLRLSGNRENCAIAQVLESPQQTSVMWMRILPATASRPQYTQQDVGHVKGLG